MNEINIKLTIDGQEAVQTLKLTQAEYNKLYTTFAGFQGFPPEAYTSMKALQSELLKTVQVTEETTQATAEFIQYYGLSEKQIQQVILSLREEQKALSINSSEYRAHAAAIANISGAYEQVRNRQASFSQGTSQVQRGTGSMNMAMMQFGYVLNDSQAFLMSYKLGLMGIANNLPMIAQYFAAAKKEAGELGQTVGQSLISSLKGPGGLILAINAVMLAMQLLPSIFSDTTKEVKKQTDEIKKLKDEYSNLTSEQIKNYLVELDKQMGALEKKYPKSTKVGNYSTVIGGLAPSPNQPLVDAPIPNRFGSETETYQDLQNRKKALEDVLKNMGAIRDIENNIMVNREKYRNLNENNWATLVPGAKDLKDAQIIVDGWIKAQEKILDQGKGKKGDKPDTYEEKVSKMLTYYDELTKIDSKYNAAYKSFLDDQLNYYLNTLAKQKGGLDKLSAEQLGVINDLKEKLGESRFAPKIAGGIEARGLDARGMTGIPLSDRETKERKDALAKERELRKMRSELFGEGYDEERQQIEDWKDNAMDKYQLDLENHKTTTEEKELIDQLYHKKLADLEEKSLKKKLDGYQKTIDAAGSIFNNLFNLASTSARDEIGEWKDKEEKKLDEEHKAAIAHARSQKDRERIDAQFQAKKEKLDDEANEKAKEKLLLLFRLKQAADIAQATMSTYTAAENAMKDVPFPFNFAAAALVVAGGLANVAMISQQKIPGYARGSMGLVGENGPEIIAPLDTYAQGQAELINRTIMAIQGGQNASYYEEIRRLSEKFEKYANAPVPIINTFDKGFAKQSTRIGLAGMKRDKLK